MTQHTSFKHKSKVYGHSALYLFFVCMCVSRSLTHLSTCAKHEKARNNAERQRQFVLLWWMMNYASQEQDTSLIERKGVRKWTGAGGGCTGWGMRNNERRGQRRGSQEYTGCSTGIHSKRAHRRRKCTRADFEVRERGREDKLLTVKK